MITNPMLAYWMDVHTDRRRQGENLPLVGFLCHMQIGYTLHMDWASS